MQFGLNEYHRNVSEEELISDIRLVAKKLNKSTVTTGEYVKHGRFSRDAILRNFGSWDNALKAALLESDRRNGNEPYRKRKESRGRTALDAL